MYIVDGELWRRDLSSADSVPVLERLPFRELAPGRPDGRASFDSSGTQLAALFADTVAQQDGTVLLVIDPEDASSARTLTLEGRRSQRVEWIDSRHVLVSGGDTAYLVDTDTMTAIASWPLEVGTELSKAMPSLSAF